MKPIKLILTLTALLALPVALLADCDCGRCPQLKPPKDYVKIHVDSSGKPYSWWDKDGHWGYFPEVEADGTNRPPTFRDWKPPILTNYFFRGPMPLGWAVTNMLAGVGATNGLAPAMTKPEVCAAYGHRWEGGCGMMGCLVIHYGPMRHCTFCEKTEAYEGAWK